MTLVRQSLGECLVKRTDGKRQAAFVFNQRGHMLSYLVPDIIYLPAVEIYRGIGRMNQKIKFSRRKIGVAKGAGDQCVDLTDTNMACSRASRATSTAIPRLQNPASLGGVI